MCELVLRSPNYVPKCANSVHDLGAKSVFFVVPLKKAKKGKRASEDTRSP